MTERAAVENQDTQNARAPEDARATNASKPAKAEKPAKQTKADPNVWRSFSVDLWWNDLNDVEVGLYKHSQHRAKSRQFSQDSDVIGEVLEDGERTGLVTYREGAWAGDGKSSAKRLVVKLFTPSMNWKGSLELMTGRSLQLSLGANGFPVTAFSLVINNHDQVITLERSPRKLPGFPETFSFFILKDGVPALYRLRRDWLSIRANYSLYDQKSALIGRLHGRIFNLGGRWDVTLRKDSDCRELDAVLQLFCAMLRFNAQSKRHIQTLLNSVNQGEAIAEIAKEEAALYANPRRLQ
jgi:hypothetical protein